MKPYVFHKNHKGYDAIIIGNRLVYWEIVDTNTHEHIAYLRADENPIKYINRYLRGKER